MFGKVQLTSFVFTALALSTSGAVARPHRARVGDYDPTVQQRDLSDEEVLELFARSGAAAKIGKDLIGFAPNAISSADKKLKAAHSTDARNKMGPSPFSKAAKPVGYASHSSSSKKKRELEDELMEILARSGAAAKIGKDLIGFAPNAISSADKQLKASHSVDARNKHGPSPFSKAAKPVGYAGHSSSSKKKRDLEDALEEPLARSSAEDELEELLARSGAAGKIGKDVIGFAPNVISSVDKHLKAAHSTEARNKMGPSPFSKAAKPVGYAGHSSSSKKKRELEDELEELLARSGAAGKIGKDVIGFAPNVISSVDKHLKAAHSTEARNKMGPSPFSKAAKPVGFAGHSSSSKKKRELEDELMELLARSGAAAKIGKDLIGFAPNAISSADKKLKAAHSTEARNKMGPSPFSKAAKPVGYAGHSSSSKKKRDFEDELMEIFARSGAAGKIGKDVIGFAPNVISSVDKHLKAAHSTDARNKMGPSPFSKAAKPVGFAGHSSSSKKKRDLVDALGDYLEARSLEIDELEARSFEYDELDELE